MCERKKSPTVETAGGTRQEVAEGGNMGSAVVGRRLATLGMELYKAVAKTKPGLMPVVAKAVDRRLARTDQISDLLLGETCGDQFRNDFFEHVHTVMQCCITCQCTSDFKCGTSGRTMQT